MSSAISGDETRFRRKLMKLERLSSSRCTACSEISEVLMFPLYQQLPCNSIIHCKVLLYSASAAMEVAKMNTQKILRFKVNGMTCGGCVRAVQRILSNIPGVRELEVRVGSVTMEFDEAFV